MLTPEQLETRRGYWTASDTVQAMTGGRGGLIAIAATKRWPRDVSEPTPAMDEGNILESHIGSWALARLGIGFTQTEYQPWRTLDGTRLAATLDWLLPTGEPLETKAVGIISGEFAPGFDEWGEDGTDQIPMAVWWQVQHQMVVVNAPAGYVAALIAGKGHRLYRIERNPKMRESLIRLSENFWKKYVDVAEDVAPPEIGLAEAVIIETVLKSVKRQPKKRIQAPQLRRAFDDWRALSEARKTIDRAETAAQDRVVFGLGDAEEADLGDGLVISYHRVTDMRFRQAEFKAANPELYELYKLPGPKQEPLKIMEDANGGTKKRRTRN